MYKAYPSLPTDRWSSHPWRERGQSSPWHCIHYSEVLTFDVRVRPVVVVSATGMLVAEALAIVRGKRDLPVARADKFLTEFACHGHAVLDAEFST